MYCNCDDPRASNFFHYFSYNFEHLGLKRLITTCYRNQSPTLFSQNDADRAIWLEYTGDQDGNNVPDAHEIGINYLEGDGDFRSPEALSLLNEADIVVTNPPFSKFRQYVAQLIEHDKKFLIIGNKNAITYQEIFPLIQENKLWVGNTPMGRDMLFTVPEDIEKDLVLSGKEGSSWKRVDGVVYARSSSVWFTNLDTVSRNEDLILWKTYSPDDYPTYDNYDAIEVGKTQEIPVDYPGVMGVPISFLGKHNPQQFEIVGIAKSPLGQPHKLYPKQIQVSPDGKKTSVTKLNDAAALKIEHPPKGKTYYEVNGDLFVAAYARLLIRARGSSDGN